MNEPSEEETVATLRSAGHSSSAKRGSSPAGILQPLAVQDHPLQRRRRRPDETHEPQPPAAGIVAGLALAALGANDAVSAGTEEQQRLDAVRVLSVDLEDRAHERSIRPVV